MPVFLIYSFYYPAGKIAILVGGKTLKARCSQKVRMGKGVVAGARLSVNTAKLLA
jgi:hypothetical protein